MSTITANETELSEAQLKVMNPIGSAGIVVKEKDTGRVKICDGTTDYAHLAYVDVPLRQVGGIFDDIEQTDVVELQPLTDLSFQIPAHSRWRFEVILFASMNDTGLSAKFTGPAGAVLKSAAVGLDPSNNSRFTLIEFDQTVELTGGDSPAMCRIVGTIECGAIPGTVALNVARHASVEEDNPTTLTIQVGSSFAAELII